MLQGKSCDSLSDDSTLVDFQEIEEQELEEKIEQERRITEDFGNSTIGRLRKKLWNITEYPETSLAAKARLSSIMTRSELKDPS